ncbi:MAG: hypothetical protein LBG48_05935 [Rickettsiales bacterium]|jgi:hypothetical protein|nr:hypothetical protein [Rickettsiales bacterium]
MDNASLKNVISTVVRLDKNIAHNIDCFGGLMEEAAHVTIQLVYHFCETYQNNIFGFGILDPDEFANKYQLDKHNLKRKAKDPVQLQGKADAEIKAMYARQANDPSSRVFDSILENALYILLSRNIVLTRGGKKVVQGQGTGTYGKVGTQEEVVYDKLISIQVLQNLEVVFKKSRRGEQKVLYYYVLNPDIIGNLTEYFLVSNKNNLISLRGNKTERLYLFLVNLRDSMFVHGQTSTTIESTPSFLELCHVAGVDTVYKSGVKAGSAKDAKYVKRDLKQKLDYLIAHNEDKNFSFTYHFVHGKPGHRWAYVCLFDFALRHENSVKEKEWRHSERKSIYINNIFYEFLDYFKKLNSRTYASYCNNPDMLQNVFLRWLKSDVHIEEKTLAYRNAYFKTYHNLHMGFDIVANRFVARLATIENIDDFKNLSI